MSIDHLNEARTHLSNGIEDVAYDGRAVPQLREAMYHLGHAAAERDKLRAKLALAEQLLKRCGPAVEAWKRDGETRKTTPDGVFHLVLGSNHYQAMKLQDDIDAAIAGSGLESLPPHKDGRD